MASVFDPPGRFVAQQRKKIHDSSAQIYPNREKSDNASSAITSYVTDFAKKEGKPALPRPCSVTRRNRPHPSKNFLNWRIPSRPMPGHKTTDADKAFVNLSVLETKERFYDDYVGRFNSEKYKLCKQVGSLPSCYPPRPRLLQRADLQDKPNDESSYFPRCMMPPLCISKDAEHKYDTLVSKASSKERIIVESCLDAGDLGYIGKTFAYVIRPEAIPAIHQWLKSQNETDRDVVFRFLNKLNKSTTNNLDRQTDRKSCKLPLCLDKNTTAEISRAGRNAISDQVRQKLSRDFRPKDESRPVKHPHLRRSKKATRLPLSPTQHFITNKNALFMQPHRCLPGHFEIHPEFHYITAK